MANKMKMRMAGRIKRFVTKSSSNSYGFIAPLALDDQSAGMVFDANGNIIAYVTGWHHDDVYVHQSECLCVVSSLKEGTLVSFDCDFNKRKEKYEASRLILLQNETDEILLEKYSKSRDEEARALCFCASLQILPLNIAFQKLSAHRDEIEQNALLYKKYLSPKYYLHRDAFWLRRHLSFREQCNACLTIINDNEVSGVVEILVELVDIVADNCSIVPHEVWNNNKQLEAFVECLIRKMDVSSDYTKREIVKRIEQDGSAALEFDDVIFRILPIDDQVKRSWLTSPHPFVRWDKMSFEVQTRIIERCISEKKFIVHLSDFVDNRMLEGLSDELQVELCLIISSPRLKELWPFMSTRAKLLLIYKSASEGKTLPQIECGDDEEAIVKFVYKLLMYERQSKHGKNIFQEAHEILQEDVIRYAWDEELDKRSFDLLLPPCSFAYSNVAFCEGRPWREHTQEAYCPRTGNPCRVATANDVLGARSLSENFP